MISLVLLWLRAAGLVGQAISLGGAIFALGVLRPARTRAAAGMFDRVLTLITFGALLAAAAQAGVLVALAKVLGDDVRWPLRRSAYPVDSAMARAIRQGSRNAAWRRQ